LKPVAIFQHGPTDGPGHFAIFLERHRIPFRVFNLPEGERVPGSASGFSGLGFMGGAMSVNDDIDWIAAELELIRDAVAKGIPVIGHCLGGQLLSKALGGVVSASPIKEIGWSAVESEDNTLAREWLGADPRRFVAFQWHGETFTIPPGGERILRSEHCPNQAYVVGDRHLGMQCHVEMTADMVEDWCATGGDEIAASRDSPAVHGPEAIRASMNQGLKELGDTADRLYSRWIRSLAA
jgi:GMP synthase-like glutamine amidotransferase